MTTVTATKRTYLPRKQRRKQLLKTAAEIVEKEGWDRLNMSFLAERANASRQLVYQHFESLEELMLATGNLIFQQVYVATGSALQLPISDPATTMRQVQQATLNLPPGRSRALWQLLANNFPKDHELSKLSERMRGMIIQMYQPTIASVFGLEQKQAAAVSWMLVMAFWGGYQLVDSGDMSKDEAIESLNWIVSKLVQDSQTPS